MPTNIEIKFRFDDLELVERNASAIADSGPELLIQEDVFFNVDNGRLKLRKFGDGSAELIAYHRSDSDSIRESNWQVYRTSDPDALQSALAITAGQGITVSKTRALYLVGQTRIHLDRVEGLGNFVELEVVLADNDSNKQGHAIANGLVEELGLDAAERISVSYADLLAVNQ